MQLIEMHDKELSQLVQAWPSGLTIINVGATKDVKEREVLGCCSGMVTEHLSPSPSWTGLWRSLAVRSLGYGGAYQGPGQMTHHPPHQGRAL